MSRVISWCLATSQDVLRYLIIACYLPLLQTSDYLTLTKYQFHTNTASEVPVRVDSSEAFSSLTRYCAISRYLARYLTMDFLTVTKHCSFLSCHLIYGAIFEYSPNITASRASAKPSTKLLISLASEFAAQSTSLPKGLSKRPSL